MAYRHRLLTLAMLLLASCAIQAEADVKPAYFIAIFYVENETWAGGTYTRRETVSVQVDSMPACLGMLKQIKIHDSGAVAGLRFCSTNPLRVTE